MNLPLIGWKQPSDTLQRIWLVMYKNTWPVSATLWLAVQGGLVLPCSWRALSNEEPYFGSEGGVIRPNPVMVRVGQLYDTAI